MLKIHSSPFIVTLVVTKVHVIIWRFSVLKILVENVILREK